MTATIMPSTAATALVPATVSASGGKGQDATASEQPFGSLMAAVQAAATPVDGKAVVPGATPAPVSIMASMAGKLLPRAGRDEAVAKTSHATSVVTAEAETQVGLVADHPADEAATPATEQEAEPAKPVEVSTGISPEIPLPIPGATAPLEGEVVKLPERGATVADDDDAPHPSRPRSGTDTKPAQALPDPSVPVPATVPTQQPPQPMAAHLPRQLAMPEQDSGPLPTHRMPEGIASAHGPSATDDGNGPVQLSAQPAGPDPAPATPQPPLAGTHGESGQPGMSFGQTLLPVAARDSSQIYGGALAPTATPSHDQPVVSAQAGQMGQAMGVAIARGVDAGREALLVRLDPAEMGRIHVRLSFDHDGAVRVAMSADSPVALDLLRREASDLGRALSDAGVRADSQSFRFDGGGSQGQGFAQQRSGSGEGGQSQGGQFAPDGVPLPEVDIPPGSAGSYRGLRSAGGLNLII